MGLWDSIGIEYGFGKPLSTAFFERDPREVAPDLLGKIVASVVDGELAAGRVVETEAYLGANDAGSHAATKGITKRNSVMYGEPGCAYVYFTYGNHHMLNLVCERAGIAGAVLVRALEPVAGVDTMVRRRGGRSGAELCNGPGKLAAALGIDLADNAAVLGSGRLHVYAGMRPVALSDVAISGRIGLREGHELPYRYFDSSSPSVSRGRHGESSRKTRRQDDEGRAR